MTTASRFPIPAAFPRACGWTICPSLSCGRATLCRPTLSSAPGSSIERTASGIDTIFFEQFRNGRPAPNYARSNETRRVAACPATEQRRGHGMRVARKITARGYAITARSNICPVGVVEAQEVHCPSHATPWLFLLKHGTNGSAGVGARAAKSAAGNAFQQLKR
jgi:hypothetical protein